MLTEKEISVLLSREPRRINASFIHETPKASLSDDELAWHEQHRDMHSAREAMLVLDGKVNQRLDSDFFEGTPGSLFLFSHNELHDNGYYHATRGVFLWIFLHVDGFLGILTENNESGIVSRDSIQFSNRNVMDRLTNVWDMLEQENLEGDSRLSCIAEITALFNLLFAEAFRKFSGPHSRARDPEAALSPQYRIDLIKNYIREHIGQKTDIRTLARFASVSQSHFFRLFREYAGCTVKQYVETVRLDKYNILMHRKRPRKEIAYELGFSSTVALCHWLKKHSAEAE